MHRQQEMRQQRQQDIALPDLAERRALGLAGRGEELSRGRGTGRRRSLQIDGVDIVRIVVEATIPRLLSLGAQSLGKSFTQFATPVGVVPGDFVGLYHISSAKSMSEDKQAKLRIDLPRPDPETLP